MDVKVVEVIALNLRMLAASLNQVEQSRQYRASRMASQDESPMLKPYAPRGSYEMSDAPRKSTEHDKTVANFRKKWTNDDDDTLILMSLDGKSYKEMGEAIGRSSGAAKVRVHKLRKEGRLEATS